MHEHLSAVDLTDLGEGTGIATSITVVLDLAQTAQMMFEGVIEDPSVHRHRLKLTECFLFGHGVMSLFFGGVWVLWMGSILYLQVNGFAIQYFAYDLVAT